MNNNPILALIIRVFISALVVFGTYNPTGKSVYHWIKGHEDKTDAWVVLAGIVTCLAILCLVIAAWKTFGILGTTIIAVLFGAVTYLFIQEGWVTTATGNDSAQWFGLTLLSVFFGLGLAGAIIWRKITGQVVTDEAGDLD